MMPDQEFKAECEAEILQMGADSALHELTKDWLTAANRAKYSYHFEFLGRPIIQYPQDMVAVQELIWEIKPDLIIETGIAHGGSLVMSASMLALLDLCEAQEAGIALEPNASRRRVVGVDIDIRAHNREAVESHPMASRITMIQGSSTAADTVEQVHRLAEGYERILVCLDSNHTHEHVLAELQAYAPLASLGSYCVVFDTVVDDLPPDMFPDRPWGPGDNPKTAVHEYLRSHPEFIVDRKIEQKLLVTVAPNGYLRRVGG
tara:strand:+ start:145 stop:927 length:783 start_codon:yes stop_codon:yes gene_type:complete